MAAFNSNPINLPNLPVKGTPVGADVLPLFDSVGLVMSQCLVSSLPGGGGGGAFPFTPVTAGAPVQMFFSNTYASLDATFPTLILPTTSSPGNSIWIMHNNISAGIMMSQNANQCIIGPGDGYFTQTGYSSTVGTGGGMFTAGFGSSFGLVDLGIDGGGVQTFLMIWPSGFGLEVS